MEIKIFTDVIDALEKVANSILSIKDIPKSQRKEISQAIEEAFTLLNSAVNLVYHRLGDLLLEDSKEELIKDLRSLDNSKEWWELEREVRLCRGLRAAHSVIDSYTLGKMPLRLGSKDWDKVRTLVDEVLEREGNLADFISEKLTALSEMGESASSSEKEYKKAVESIKRIRTRLRKDRQRLLRSEIQFIESISPKR